MKDLIIVLSLLSLAVGACGDRNDRQSGESAASTAKKCSPQFAERLTDIRLELGIIRELLVKAKLMRENKNKDHQYFSDYEVEANTRLDVVHNKILFFEKHFKLEGKCLLATKEHNHSAIVLELKKKAAELREKSLNP